jgi:two-component system NtrC family sensor kinase
VVGRGCCASGWLKMTGAVGGSSGSGKAAEMLGPLGGRGDSREYFGKLRWRLRLGFLLALLAPLAALSLYFHFLFDRALKESGKLHLASLAESQRNTIDLFLQERVVNIFSLFHGSEFPLSPTQQDMDRYLQDLRQASDAFVDVGFCNAEGVQIGYAGPFPQLSGKDYSSEDWFKSVMGREKNYYVSDIYLGFRHKPHFTIAVRQRLGTKPYVMRATLDPDKFYIFLRNISRGKGVDSALVNKSGYYQVVDPDRGELLGRSEYVPSQALASGVEEIGSNGDSILVAYVWLEETPWALVVRQPLSIAYAEMYQARKIIIASIALIALVMGLLVWVITDRVLRRAQADAEAREKLQVELVHVSKLASIGELAAGIAHEINNPLAIIGATSGVIRDLFDPEFHLEWTPETVNSELGTIDAAVSRARTITQRLLEFSRKSPPRLVPSNVNEILDNVVGG